MLERLGLRTAERALTGWLVLLKLYVLRHAWGKLQGYDPIPWLEVFRLTKWFKPLPAAASLFGSYHPPLSYLLCRLIYALYPHEIEASQILSTVAILGAVFAIRYTLRTIGVLYTLPGLMVLYVTASLPLVVWLQTETSYDPLIFMWVMVAMALSARLFWMPMPEGWWRRPGNITALLFLCGVLAMGMLTKFNAIVAFLIPFLVIAVRRRRRLNGGEVGAAIAACACAVVLISPLYYERYYLPLHVIFPQPIEWLKTNEWRAAVAIRDANPHAFWGHMLRLPDEPMTHTQDPVTDSFIHSIWLQLWKRDSQLGHQGPEAIAISDLYIQVFALILVGGTVCFFVRRRRLPGAWRDLGDILFAVSAVYCGLLLYFGYKYPLWEWRVFKAKYVTPAVLWIGYCVALPVLARPAPFDGAQSARGNLVGDVLLLVAFAWCLAPFVFMTINHLVPVY